MNVAFVAFHKDIGPSAEPICAAVLLIDDGSLIRTACLGDDADDVGVSGI